MTIIVYVYYAASSYYNMQTKSVDSYVDDNGDRYPPTGLSSCV